MDENRVSEYLLEQGCEWIPFLMNTPHSSHMGRAWERQIGTLVAIQVNKLPTSTNKESRDNDKPEETVERNRRIYQPIHVDINEFNDFDFEIPSPLPDPDALLSSVEQLITNSTPAPQAKRSRDLQDIQDTLGRLEHMMHHIATTMCTFKSMVETRLDNLESKTTYTAPNLECHNQTQNPLPILANITSALYEQFNISRESSISSDNTIDNPIELHEADGQVYVGGFDEVCLDKDVYHKIVVQSKPNKMSLLLAEALYGNENLGQSTITGKIGTHKLDEVILNAIKERKRQELAKLRDKLENASVQNEGHLGAKGSQGRGKLWQKIAESLNPSTTRKFCVDDRGIRERYNLLKSKHKGKMSKEIKASGISPEESEYTKLITEVIDLEEASTASLETGKKVDMVLEREKAEDIRLKAMETLAETKKRKELNKDDEEEEEDLEELIEKKPKRFRRNANETLSYLKTKNEIEREGFSKFNKIYEFNCNILNANAQMVMTSVSGHLMGLEFSQAYRKWNSCSPLQLFTAPVAKYVGEDYQKIKNPTAVVTGTSSRPKSKWRPVALDTVELEKLASRKMRINAKETMKIAEKLYNKGFISYPRTETNMFPSSLNLVELIEKQTQDQEWGGFATGVLTQGPNPRQGRKTDNAHPSIHPTNYTNNLQGNEKRVYEFIVHHFLACCSKPMNDESFVVQSPSKLFIYDTNNDGRISQDEFRAISPTADEPDDTIPAVFSSMDKNGDDFVDCDEFLDAKLNFDEEKPKC
ncbi:hypothetical protein QZH41_002967 [Actinostola sp. cb2023]|nr:hypothetical protein QZH41_002967 [Actinostola sp. cb2023]